MAKINTNIWKLRTDKIWELCRHQPMTLQQLAFELCLTRGGIVDYINHMVNKNALVISHKDKRLTFYKSADVYVVRSDEDIELRQRKDAIKPFIDEMLWLTFGKPPPIESTLHHQQT